MISRNLGNIIQDLTNVLMFCRVIPRRCSKGRRTSAIEQVDIWYGSTSSGRRFNVGKAAAIGKEWNTTQAELGGNIGIRIRLCQGKVAVDVTQPQFVRKSGVEDVRFAQCYVLAYEGAVPTVIEGPAI